MAAGTYNFTLEQGSTFSRVITVQENSAAMDLSGYTARMQMRSTHDSSTVTLSFTASVTDATGGQITLSSSATTTAGIEEGIYVYDLEIESSAGTVTRLMEGQVTVTPEVTR
jgi:hypothetical protein